MLSVHSQPDALTAARHLAVEREAEAAEQAKRHEVQMGKVRSFESERNWHGDRSLTSAERSARSAIDTLLNVTTQDRQTTCYMSTCGCQGTPVVWVREIGFDRRELSADLDLAQITTADYDGPVPGFCLAHVHDAPIQLAQRVYFTTPLMQWGYLPTRWFVRFTDSTSMRGEIRQINPTLAQPTL